MNCSSIFLLCILVGLYWIHAEAGDCHCTCVSHCNCTQPEQPKVVKWVRVTKYMLGKSEVLGVQLQTLDLNGGVEIRGRVTANGCGPPGSGAVVYINGNWERIMYTQEFTGSASCWKIFGNSQGKFAFDSKKMVDNGLIPFSSSGGDAIMSQLKMHTKAADYFDGITKRCDNENQNFWHQKNGAGTRRATVALRRKKGALQAGISTETSCGTPSYVIKDIYIS